MAEQFLPLYLLVLGGGFISVGFLNGMDNLLGEVIGKAGLKQLRLAETQKFKHVTSFFNGKLLKPYTGEDRIEIKGTFDPSSYADHPQMNAPEVAEEALRQSEARERARADEIAAILDVVPVSVLIAHDAECRRVTGNRTTYALRGLPHGVNISPQDADFPSFRIAAAIESRWASISILG